MNENINIKCLLISDDIYKPVLVKQEILEPYLMEIEVMRVGEITAELYIVSADAKYKYYLDLYSNVISQAHIIVFHLKESTAKGRQFKNWLKLIPVSAAIKVAFVIESNVSTVMEDFRERLQGYWRKQVDDSVIWLNSTIDRSQIINRITEGREKLINTRDYIAESNAISQVKSFFKFGTKSQQNAHNGNSVV